MDQAQLKAIVVLSEELHFGRTAQRLGITQPALSQKVSKVENELGVILFTRAHRRIAVTEVGRIFIAHARSALIEMETAVRMAQKASAGQVGQLHLGFVENASFDVLPKAVSAYRRRFPEVDLRLSEMISAELLEKLLAGRLDIALMRPIKTELELKRRLVHQEPYVAVLPVDHPLAAASSVRIEDLAKLPMIIAAGAKATYLREQFGPLFARLGHDIVVGQEVNQLPAMLSLVSSGIGYALLPKSVTNINVPGVTYLPLATPNAPQAELVAVWRGDETNPAIKYFLSFLPRVDETPWEVASRSH
ncbi:LysR family transcriptional regulator [Modicisalibacter radicis]|uniref:LysR family transcriptional regulator n=1 Tax=Halomonas sp. EAR18 TaxID=2518972 RepID=UPI001443F5BB|nr:LysR family transcriptional regulator [Halomonas sp. EAR18]